MVKIIAGVLTSPCNAHSLTPGDRIWQGKDQFEIVSIVQIDQLIQLTLRDEQGREELFFPPWISINLPIDRVVGARSGGQIGCS